MEYVCKLIQLILYSVDENGQCMVGASIERI